jgi:hypothetical protein
MFYLINEDTVNTLTVGFVRNLQVSVRFLRGFLLKSFSKIFLRIQKKKCLASTQTSCCQLCSTLVIFYLLVILYGEIKEICHLWSKKR